MKSDKQFIESVYSKQKAYKKAQKEKTLTLAGVALAFCLVACGVLYAFLGGGNASAPVPQLSEDTDVVVNSSASSEEPSISHESKEETKHILTHTGGNGESFGYSSQKISDNISLITQYGAVDFCAAVMAPENANCYFPVTISLNTRNAFIYNGNYLEDTVYNENGYYFFVDGNHKEYNRFYKEFSYWYNNVEPTLKEDLIEQIALGNDEAQKTYNRLIQIEQQNDRIHGYELFYELVWKEENSSQTVAAFNAQKAEFDNIMNSWAAFNQDDVLQKTLLEEEAERLVSEGYDLYVKHYNGGNSVIKGVLSAEQIKSFKTNPYYNYECHWVVQGGFVCADNASVTVVTTTGEESD